MKSTVQLKVSGKNVEEFKRGDRLGYAFVCRCRLRLPASLRVNIRPKLSRDQGPKSSRDLFTFCTILPTRREAPHSNL